MNRGLAANINARVGPDDILWCLGDWAFGRGGDYLRNARWFRDQIRCRTVHLIWGNHDDRKIRDLFSSTHDQAEIRDGGVRITLNHYPMLTWNGQHHASVAEPNIHLYGHVHALYQQDPEASPLEGRRRLARARRRLRRPRLPGLVAGRDPGGFRPRLEAFEALKRSRASSTRSAAGATGRRGSDTTPKPAAMYDMNLRTEPYLAQQARWLSSGRHILALSGVN